LKRQIKYKDKNFKKVWDIKNRFLFSSATPFDLSDRRFINFPDWLKKRNSGEPLKKENEVFLGFGEDLEGFDGGARRTKKRRRRNNKTKLVRRPQNRVYQRRTSRKRNKN